VRGRPLGAIVAAFVGSLVLGLGAQQYFPPIGSTFSAGSGTGTFRSSGVQFGEYLHLAVAANTNYVSSSVYTVPANTLVNTGDVLFLDLNTSYGSVAGTKSTYCNLGYTAYDATQADPLTGGIDLVALASTATTTTQHVSTQFIRTGATTYAMNQRLNGVSTANSWVTGTYDWAVAQPVRCVIRDSGGTASNAFLEIMRLTVSGVP
jgi:hypothetical protein